MFVPILQPTGMYLSCLLHLFVPDLSNIFGYTWYSTPNTYLHTDIYTNVYIHICTHADIPTTTGYPTGTPTNDGFQYSRSLDYSTLRLRIFRIWSWRLFCQRHLSACHLPQSWPTTSMAHYRQQHPVNHNAAQVARTKPSQYDRLSTRTMEQTPCSLLR